MKTVTHLIVGGGMAGAAAAQAIAKINPEAGLAVLCAESDPPYDRPPLTKDLWTGGTLDDVWRNTEETGAEILTNRRAVLLDPERCEVTDDTGGVIRYENLLLATGGHPKTLDFGENIVYYRTLADYRRVRELTDARDSAIVIGGGFIGAEIAAGLAQSGLDVTMVFPETGINARLFPESLSKLITAYYRDKGVDVRAGRKPVALSEGAHDVRLRLDDGVEIRGGFVVAGLGVRPATELAEQGGLRVDNGIVVDEHCRSSDPRIFAAGDAARFPCSLLHDTIRVEHEDNANSMGTAAGRNMAGDDESYDYLPFFYSDLFDLGYEALGRTSSDMEMVDFWTDDHQKGIVFYRQLGRVQGAVFWNVWDMLAPCRELMAGGDSHANEALRAWVERNTDLQ